MIINKCKRRIISECWFAMNEEKDGRAAEENLKDSDWKDTNYTGKRIINLIKPSRRCILFFMPKME